MGGGAGAGGGRAARVLRLLLLLVFALAAVEYLFGSILDASPLKTYLYTPLANVTQASLKNGDKVLSYWPKRLPVSAASETPVIENKNFTNLNNSSWSHVPNTTSNMPSSRHLNAETSTSLVVTKILESLKDVTVTEGGELKSNESELPLCDEMPPELGPISVSKKDLQLKLVEKKYPEVHPGGRYVPPNCTARYRVAIIVPYRDRQEHLAIFLNHMHPFLMRQQLEYGIYIVEQNGKNDFNRAKLMNVGFMESQRLTASRWNCFIFHDIDLLPLDGRNMYSCPRQPRHMSVAIDTLNNRLPYEDIFGGVSAMTLEQFTKVNGFSNKYWGWGGEDDDMSYRVRKMGYHIARYKTSIARYAMLNHKKSSPNPKRYQLLSQTNKVFQKDGLSTLKYEMVKVTKHHLYTHILANIEEHS